MKKIFFFVWLLGIVLLVSTLLLFLKKYAFINSAEPTIAIVVNYDVSSSIDSDGESSQYFYPILTFIDRQGGKVIFKSSVGSGIPSYEIGERVDILYDLKDPHEAEVNRFLSLWFGVLILGIFGIITFTIGGIVFLYLSKKTKIKREMLNNGRSVQAKIISIELNSILQVNGRSPYIIYSQWVDRLNPGAVYMFKSENIWFNPISYINKETISVFIDETNPHRYYVDISFLPKIK